jgi:hypothetical protein
MVKVSAALQAIAGGLEDVLADTAGTRVGFVLLVMPFGEPTGQRANYISNCDRACMIEAFTELLEHWKAGGPMLPAHQVQG